MTSAYIARHHCIAVHNMALMLMQHRTRHGTKHVYKARAVCCSFSGYVWVCKMYCAHGHTSLYVHVNFDTDLKQSYCEVAIWWDKQMLRQSDGEMAIWPDAHLLRCSDAQMHRCSDAQMLRCSDAQMLKWLDGLMVRWSEGQMVRRLDGKMITCTHGQVVTWLHCTWSGSHMARSECQMATWSDGQMAR